MILQLKIQIKDISKPPVWRKVLVPGDFTFHQLHQVILRAFGWAGHHLYTFTPSGFGSFPSIEQVTNLDPGYDAEYIDMDSKKTKLSKVLGVKGMKFTYTYDFGDDWEHRILVEEVIKQKATEATLIAGKGKCPPDDCGGVWGYKDLLETINDPKHKDYKSMRKWLMLEKGASWDPHEFNLEIQAQYVKHLFV